VNHDISMRHPVSYEGLGYDRAFTRLLDLGDVRSVRWCLAQFVPYFPKGVAGLGRFSTEVRAADHDHRQLQSLALRLLRTGDADVHAVWLAVSVAVELSFNPQVVSDPFVRILETRHDLRLTVSKNGNCRFRITTAGGHHTKGEQEWGQAGDRFHVRYHCGPGRR
jgi:hypothetical protein